MNIKVLPTCLILLFIVLVAVFFNYRLYETATNEEQIKKYDFAQLMHEQKEKCIGICEKMNMDTIESNMHKCSCIDYSTREIKRVWETWRNKNYCNH